MQKRVCEKGIQKFKGLMWVNKKPQQEMGSSQPGSKGLWDFWNSSAARHHRQGPGIPSSDGLKESSPMQRLWGAFESSL